MVVVQGPDVSTTRPYSSAICNGRITRKKYGRKIGVNNVCAAVGRAIGVKAHEASTPLDTLWRDVARRAAAATCVCSAVCVAVQQAYIHGMFW